MLLSTWLLYLAIAALNIMSPGPAVLLAVSNSVSLGLRRVLFSSLGNALGVMLVSGMAVAGLGTVLKSSAMFFTLLKFAGAAYLIYLGIKQWRSKATIFRMEDATAALATTAPSNKRTNLQLFVQGLALALTNPKAILFFTALFPQFLAQEKPLLPQFAIMTGTFMLLSFCSLMSYAALARRAKDWFYISRHAIYFNRATGGLFMLLGVSLLRLKNTRS